MNTRPDAELLFVASMNFSEATTPTQNAQAPAHPSHRPKSPFLDADPDDFVPGYSDHYAWYEP